MCDSGRSCASVRCIRRTFFCAACEISAKVPTKHWVTLTFRKYGRLLGAGKEVLAEVRAWSVANSKAIWSRMIDHRDRLPLGHDGYLKLWALGRPKLGYQYVLLDEAQDTNPVVLGVHGHPSAQIVYVGDKLLLATHFRNQTAHRAVRLGLDG